MTKIRWTPEAAADLLGIHDYIARDSPNNAFDICERIYDAISGLSQFPLRGRPGQLEDTRELTVARLPYLIVYELRQGNVVVLRIIHGAMRWPW